MSKRKASNTESSTLAANSITINTPKTVIDKVIASIRHYKQSSGSSVKAIQKYCLTEFQYENNNAIKKALKTATDSRVLIQNKASYLVAEDPIYEDESETVHITEINIGKGERLAAKGSICSISYVGRLQENNAKFDSSKNFVFTVGEGDVIKGMVLYIARNSPHLL